MSHMVALDLVDVPRDNTAWSVYNENALFVQCTNSTKCDSYKSDNGK